MDSQWSKRLGFVSVSHYFIKSPAFLFPLFQLPSLTGTHTGNNKGFSKLSMLFQDSGAKTMPAGVGHPRNRTPKVVRDAILLSLFAVLADAMN
jgi:hypothetical protein